MRYALFLVVMLTGIANADQCMPTTVDHLVGTSCIMGSLKLTFTSEAISGINAGNVLFTPDLSDSSAPSFTISAADFSTHGLDIGILYFDIAELTPGDSVLAALGTTLVDPTVSSSSPDYTSLVSVFNCEDSISTCARSSVYTNSPAKGFPSDKENVYLSWATPNFTAGWFVSAATTDGYASMQSATYTFYVVPTPEPSSAAVMALGLIAIVGKERVSRFVSKRN